MTPEPLINDSQKELLVTLYNNAWSQYSHEESMSNVKNTLFLTANGAMIAILTGSASVILNYEKSLKDVAQRPVLTYFILGLLIFFVSALAIIINNHWRSVTFLHQQSQNIRWVSAKAIEHEWQASNIGPASVEHTFKVFKWNNDIPLFGEMIYIPYPDHEVLKTHKLKVKNTPFGGYSSITALTVVLMLFWFCILIGGAFLFASSF